MAYVDFMVKRIHFAFEVCILSRSINPHALKGHHPSGGILSCPLVPKTYSIRSSAKIWDKSKDLIESLLKYRGVVG